jgi:hypothetical protein
LLPINDLVRRTVDRDHPDLLLETTDMREKRTLRELVVPRG